MATKKQTGAARNAARAETAPAATKAAAITTEGKIRVRATRLGYYGEERKRIGDVFDITSPKHFSETWMERVDGKTRAHTSGSKEALAKQMNTPALADDMADDNPLGG